MRFGRGRVVPCGRAGCGGASVCSAWPVSGLKCNGWLWARAACVILGCVGSESLSGCAEAVACVCGSPCMGAICAVGRPVCVLEEFTSKYVLSLCPRSADAVRWEAPKGAVTGNPVPSRARGAVRSASMARVARGG